MPHNTPLACRCDHRANCGGLCDYLCARLPAELVEHVSNQARDCWEDANGVLLGEGVEHV